MGLNAVFHPIYHRGFCPTRGRVFLGLPGTDVGVIKPNVVRSVTRRTFLGLYFQRRLMFADASAFEPNALYIVNKNICECMFACALTTDVLNSICRHTTYVYGCNNNIHMRGKPE